MRKAFWFRLFDRDILLDPQQIVGALRTARGLPADDHSLPFDIAARRADSPSSTPSARTAYAGFDASLALTDVQLSSGGLPEFLAAFGFTIVPARPIEEGAQIQADVNVLSGIGMPVPGDSGQRGTAQFGISMGPSLSAGYSARFPGPEVHSYAVSYSDNLQSGVVYDTISRTLLPGGPGNFPELGQGSDDVFELGGDFSGGVDLPSDLTGIERIVLRGGNDYVLVANDNNVGIGETITIDAMPLGDDHHVAFDGRAETDGSFLFYGSESGDLFFGGAGDDRLFGFGGGDTLSGGGGSDIFVYTGAADSSGPNYDTLADFNPLADRIDLPGTVSGFGAPIEGGALSTATFNDDLGAALSGLGASQAVWFTPDEGDLAGQVFLIVDGNGQAGYQEGEDYVFAIAGTPISDLTAHTDFFI